MQIGQQRQKKNKIIFYLLLGRAKSTGVPREKANENEKK